MSDTTKIAQNSVSISQFAPDRISQIFDRLHRENRLIVCKDDQRIAVMLSPEEYDRLTGLEQEYGLLLEALERLEKNGDNNGIPMNDVMRRHGIRESDLDEIGDVAIE